MKHFIPAFLMFWLAIGEMFLVGYLKSLVGWQHWASFPLTMSGSIIFGAMLILTGALIGYGFRSLEKSEKAKEQKEKEEREKRERARSY